MSCFDTTADLYEILVLLSRVKIVGIFTQFEEHERLNVFLS